MNKRVAFVNIILGIFIILFALISFYAFSRSSAYPAGSMNKYYYLSAAGSLFFIYVLFKCNAEVKTGIALLTLSVTLSIFAIEIFLSYSGVKSGALTYREQVADYYGIPYDPRSKYQVMLDFQNNGIDAYAFHNSTQYLGYEEEKVMPLGFISDKTVIYCNESGEYVIYKSDEHGFNNPDGLYDGRGIDYVMIGDSFTLGNCVKREEHIAGFLTEKGRRVLNLGMGNSGPLYQLAILKEYAKPLKPKTVLWFFYEGNDHEGLIHEKQSSILMKYFNRDFSQSLIYKQNLVDKTIIESINKYVSSAKKTSGFKPDEKDEIKAEKQSSQFKISLSTLELHNLRSRIGLAESCTCHVNPLLKTVFTEAKRTVTEWGGELYFIYLPAWERYPEKFNYCRKRFLNSGKEQVLSIIKEMQLPVIDIEKTFSSHPDPLSMFPFRIKGHYNAKGYKLVAEELAKHISDIPQDVKNHF